MTRKVLIYTDSRGQHIPTGAPRHDVFGQRISDLSDVQAEVILCPMKWTTTLDFLELMESKDWQSFDHVILYTGIVDWSPRPQQSAIVDLYDNPAPENLENTTLNTTDYRKKVVNHKKRVFDDVFGGERVLQHLESPFDVQFENSPTINMYSLDMAADKLLPRLSKIENLIFVNSNRFVPGWKGDHKRGRPENITITERYSELFLEVLGKERVVDLLSWDPAEIQRFTCDNMHLTKAGSDWIFEKLVQKMAINGPHRPPRLAGELSVKLDRSRDFDKLNELETALSKNEDLEDFLDRSTPSVRFQINDAPIDSVRFADEQYLCQFSALYSDFEIGQIASFSQAPLDSIELVNLEQELYQDTDALENYLERKFDHYHWRTNNEYRLVRPLSTRAFPYNYLSAYANKYTSADHPHEIKKVVFIYCIKNRRVRTSISLRSLDKAFQNYAKIGEGTLQVEAMVIEDQSDDLLNANLLDSEIEIDHILVDTGIGWTRSGLLNVGLRQATGDLVAFVDADFLFHDTFLCSLEKVLNQAEWRRHVFAVNLIESEAHSKGETIYSACSPYSYMWMAPLSVAVGVDGFDEGYTGHGSEDRDFELKLTKLGGLSVTDTGSIDPECFVFHLSHNARDGFEKHQTNRKRYLERLAEEDLSKLRQDRWGEFEIVERKRNSVSLPPQKLNGNASLVASGAPKGTCYMVISCVPYAQRRALLKRWYEQVSSRSDLVVFVVGGADQTYFDHDANTLHLKCGDLYEDLPEKVLKAFLYIHQHFDFEHVVKVDDDVIINFSTLSHLIARMDAPYFGKMIPSRRGAKPSETWHFDKVSENSRHYQRPFSFHGGPENWACGGMYAVRHDGLSLIAQNAVGVEAKDFLYEDHMIGSLLHKSSIEALFIEESSGLINYRFIETDLRKVMTEDLKDFDVDKLGNKIAGVHCGPFPPYYTLSQERSLEVMSKCMSALNENLPKSSITVDPI